MAEITTEELLERYAAGERDFSNTKVWGDTLEVTILKNIILKNSELAFNFLGVDLSGADLSGVILEQGILEDVNLINANLSGIFLFQTSLTSVNFRQANLSNMETLRKRAISSLIVRAASLKENREVCQMQSNLHPIKLHYFVLDRSKHLDC